MNIVNIEFGFFTTSEQNHPSEQWGNLYMSIEISQMFLTWIMVKWPRHNILINTTLVYIYLMLLGHECSVTCQEKVALVFPKVGLAGHFQPACKVCSSLCYCLLSTDLRNTRDMSCMHLIYVWLLMVMSVIRTCHNKLNCTFNLAWKASPHFKFDFGIVFRVDVLDNQGSSSFNFNSSFIR